MITGVAYRLPGVFEGNPYPNTVNGSLWTMPYEVRMYLILVGVWSLVRFTPTIRTQLINVVIVIVALIAGAIVITQHFNNPAVEPFVRFMYMFFSGSAFYILKTRIVMSYRVFLGSVIILLFSIANISAFFDIYIHH